MTKLKIKHFDHDGVAVGGKFEKVWTADRDYIVRGILIKRKDGAAFTASDITIRINKDPLTVDHALCHTFGTTWENAWRFEEPLGDKQDFEYEGYNREGAAVDLVVELILEVK